MRSRRHRPKIKPTPRLSLPLVPICVLFAGSILLAAGAEWISRGSLVETLQWRIQAPDIFLLNVMLAGSIMLMAYGFIGTLFPSTALAVALLALMSFVHEYKLRLIGEPFFPWDVVLNREGMNIASAVTGSELWLRAAGATAVAGLLVILRFTLRKPYRIKLQTRVLFLLLPAALLLSFGLKAVWIHGLLDRAGVNEITWNQQENYKDNGLLLAFTLNMKNAVITKPAGYGEAAIAAIAQEMESLEKGANEVQAASSKEASREPNVIMIMNEAFWDPTLLQDVTFNQDPLPTIHRLQKEQTSGYLLSPQFGGGTSNVEFEVLTGLSMSQLPAGSTPYQQYIDEPLPSLASLFGSKGYSTKAIHSYEGWFWNRDQVYDLMGFDAFKSLSDFVQPEYRGAYVADAEVSRSIIREVESSKEPMFIYGVTMQNHGPYNDNRYGTTKLQAKGPLSDESLQLLETYAQGAYDADQSLKLLMEHFEESEEPTVIVFFGDHLPMLGDNYDVYREAGFIGSTDSDEWSSEELKRMRSVPFVIWSNYRAAQVKDTVPLLSTSFLGSYVLDRLSMDLPLQWQFTSHLSEQAPGLLRNLVVDGQGVLYETPPDSMKQALENYRSLQYDLLFGEQFLSGQ